MNGIRSLMAAFALLALGTTAVSQTLTNSAPASSGGDRPAEETARQALRAAIKGPLAAKLTIAEFRKTDGLAGEIGGVRTYTLEFAATLAFDGDMLFSSNQHEIHTSAPATTLNDGKEFSWEAWTNTMVDRMQPSYMGDKLNLVGAVNYVRYESGWRATELSFKASFDASGRAQGHGPAVRQQDGLVVANSTQPPARQYPKSSGATTTTRFAVRNETYGTIRIFLDGADSPIEIGGGRSYDGQLAVGSTHVMKAVVGQQTFQRTFTVPRVMRRWVVSDRGIREWSLSD